MKRGLIGILVVALIAWLSGTAMAAEISTSGDVQWKITGTSEEGEPSALFAGGDVLIKYSVTLTSGSFEGNVTPTMNAGGGALECDDAYIKFMGEAFDLYLKPVGIDYGLYDIEGNAGKPNIPSNAGIKGEIAMAPVTLTVVANNQEEYEEVEVTPPTVPPTYTIEGTGNTVYNFGAGAKLEMAPITVEGMFITAPAYDGAGAAWTFYGSAFGGKVTLDLAPLTLIGEYGSFSPEATGLEAGAGFFAEVDYALSPELTVKAKYTSIDEKLNGAGTATDHAFSKMAGELAYTLAENVTLTLDFASTDTGLVGAESITTWGAKIGVSF